jgi:hypothetical protein
MKKALLFVVAVVVLVAGGWFAALRYYEARETRAAQVAWVGLGSVDAAPQRFPDVNQSAGATKLVELAAAAQLDLAPRERARNLAAKPVTAALSKYLKAQFERGGDAIDAPPPLPAKYLADHEKALDAVRDHLLSGAPISWETNLRAGFDAPIPNLLGHMNLQRILAVRALDKARRNDPAAWDELRASWELNRGLWNRPDLISSLIALASSRMSNAAARKMPLPAPAWLNETYAFDYLGAMAASHQAEAWMIRHAMPGRGPMKVRAPWYAHQSADALDVLRTYTDAAVRSKACDADGSQFATARAAMTQTNNVAVPNLIGAWHRLMRFRAELEATERVLQLRAGETPSPQSQCSDGAWQVTANSIKFSKDVKVPPPGIRFPLEYVR